MVDDLYETMDDHSDNIAHNDDAMTTNEHWTHKNK